MHLIRCDARASYETNTHFRRLTVTDRTSWTNLNLWTNLICLIRRITVAFNSDDIK